MATDSLTGKEVALTGRLVSMTRSEAIERIARTGGRHVKMPAASTELLVAGQATAHLTREGGIPRNIIRFRTLKEEGARIGLIGESDFLRMVGAEEELEDMSRLYTAVQVSRIVETPLSEVRAWMRRGLLQPARVTNRLAWFEFTDILLARKLSQLTAAGVSLAHVHRSLAEVARWLPEGPRIIGRLEAYERGLRIRLPDGNWAETTGQRLMTFESADEAARGEISPFPVDVQEQGWLTLAAAAEEQGDLETAAGAYTRALQEAPNAETLFNLGNTLYALGREGKAAESYLQAIGMDNNFAEAWNNLGNSLAALSRPDEAIRAYEMALSLEPGYPDAHCNLATILERLGRHKSAYLHRGACERAFPRQIPLTLIREPSRDDEED